MKELRDSKAINILLWVRTLSIFFVSIATFWLIATNRSPNLLRPLSMILRTGFVIMFPILYCSLYLVFRIKGWIGNLLSFLLTLSIFALALAGVWTDGKTEAWLLSGVIPMFDASIYYIDALRLLAGQQFSEFSANKPLFVAFFSTLLWIANHDLLNALTLLTLFVGMGCYLLTNEIKRTHGPAVAVLVLLIIFIFSRIHSGVVRTENLGILFSVLGMALIWRSITERHPLNFIAGVFVTSLALIARPGPMFILPAIVIWGSFFFKPKGKLFSWKLVIGGGIAIFLAFFANFLLFWFLGARDSVPFGRFPYALYGLVSGGNSWTYVLTINPNATELDIYKMAFSLFREQPTLIVKGILYNMSVFFSNTGYGLFSYMRGETILASTVSYWVLISLSLIGLLNWIRKRDNPYLGFLAAATIGLIVSVPFLPPTDAFRLRLYSSSIVILALLPALGFWEILNYFHLGKYPIATIENQKKMYRMSIPLLTNFIMVLVFFVPFALKGSDSLSDFVSLTCSEGETSLQVRYDPGTMIHIIPQNIQFLDWAPTIHIGNFRRKVHDFPSFEFMDWALENVDAKTTLFFTLDYRTFRSAFIVVESDYLPAPPAFLGLCGEWEKSSNLKKFDIFYATSVLLSDQN